MSSSSSPARRHGRTTSLAPVTSARDQSKLGSFCAASCENAVSGYALEMAQNTRLTAPRCTFHVPGVYLICGLFGKVMPCRAPADEALATARVGECPKQCTRVLFGTSARIAVPGTETRQVASEPRGWRNPPFPPANATGSVLGGIAVKCLDWRADPHRKPASPSAQ